MFKKPDRYFSSTALAVVVSLLNSPSVLGSAGLVFSQVVNAILIIFDEIFNDID